MKALIKLFGILLVLAGISLLFAPEVIFDFLESNKNEMWVYVCAIVVRLILGVVLIIAANKSRHPLALKMLGAFIVIIAFTFLFIGQQNLQQLITTVIEVFVPYVRLMGVVSIGFGSFFLYTFSRREE
jgi:FtsH-binding integral membrane protein